MSGNPVLTATSAREIAGLRVSEAIDFRRPCRGLGDRLRLVSTLVGGADKQGPGNTGFADFERIFTKIGFDLAHTDAGWAVNGYDAMSVVEEAINKLPVTKQVQRSQVNTQISFFSSPETAVQGAGGPIVFDNDGNRVGHAPPVVRVCPLPPSQNGAPGRVRSVALEPGRSSPSC